MAAIGMYIHISQFPPSCFYYKTNDQSYVERGMLIDLCQIVYCFR